MICPVTGGVIAGGGGIVVSGSQITDAVLSKKRRSSAENIVKKYKSRVEFLMKECVEIGTLPATCKALLVVDPIVLNAVVVTVAPVDITSST
jgi:hypothetical protein